MGVVTEQDVARYHERVKVFAQSHPDYNEVLASAAKRGLNLSPAHSAEVIRLGPETVYFLAKPENEAEAREVFNVADGQYVNPDRAADAIRRLHSRLARNDTFTVITEQRDPVAEYLEKRREDFRTGKRRRR